MLSYEAVLDLVDRIYRAAQDRRLWPQALEAIGDATASAASIIHRNLGAREGGVDVAVRVDPAALAAYQSHYHRLDPWGNSPRTAALVRPGSVVDGDELIARPRLHETEYYRDFARPYGLTRVLAGTIALDGPHVAVLSLIRDDAAPPHGTAERNLLRVLLPHLTRATQIHDQLAPSGSLQRAATAALDRLASGVILVDARGRATFVNRAAERLIRVPDGLSVEHGVLTAAQPKERDALRLLIKGAASTAQGASFSAGGALSISRPSMRRPYNVLVCPLGCGGEPAHGHDAVVAVFITDPDDHATAPRETLAGLFRLTPAETRLAAGIAAGAHLAELADSLKIGRETARTQLRSVFAKTGTTSQAELVRILTRACPLLADE